MIRRYAALLRRQQEENADRAGVKYLNATQQSARGMWETFKRFTSDSMFAARGADPYLQSHPMPAERVAGAGGTGALQSLLGQAGRSRGAAAPRHGARENLGLHGEAGYRLSPLSAVQHQPARALRPRHRDLPSRRPARGDRPDRRADPGTAEQSLFLRVARPGAARGRPAGGGGSDPAQGGAALPQRAR